MSVSKTCPKINYKDILNLQLLKECSSLQNQPLNALQRIGRGSFGTVFKASWRNRFVAVKEFRAGTRRDKVEREVQHLYCVNFHPHIIELFGVSEHQSQMYLVMEYADGGSLEKFLHDPPKYEYTRAHAINWVLQCAKAVAYLHEMDLTPLLHRDLKPANLLLINECTTLKICDFGTVAELKTNMTQGRGSIPWMAPEVLTSSTYSEKCDVFSLGVILWEVFARQQPFEDEFELEWTIGFQVVNGRRPGLKTDWPEEVQNLITICWDQEPNNRPHMKTVVEILEDISKDFGGYTPIRLLF